MSNDHRLCKKGFLLFSYGMFSSGSHSPVQIAAAPSPGGGGWLTRYRSRKRQPPVFSLPPELPGVGRAELSATVFGG